MGLAGLEWADYRKADGPARSCGTCAYFRAGVCGMFDAPVEANMTCDEWTTQPVFKTDEPATAAGIAVRAADTGRVLMLQRSISEASDPARGMWEFPGGRLEAGEYPFAGAKREWQEETGVQLPAGRCTGQWRSGPYMGYVYVVPREADVPLNLGSDQRLVGNPDDPDGDDCEVLAWWAPSNAKANPALRAEAKQGTDWAAIGAAVPDGVFKAAGGVRLVKEQPTSEAVHVDGADWTGRKRKRSDEPDAAREIPDADEPELDVKVIKADRARQLVYGIVLEPHQVDSQGDWEDHATIEKAAHRYLAQTFQDGVTDLVNLQHQWDAPGVFPVESYIAPTDFVLNGERVAKGSWVLVMKVADPHTWQEVLAGDWGGFSVEGTGRRDPTRPRPPENTVAGHR